MNLRKAICKSVHINETFLVIDLSFITLDKRILWKKSQLDTHCDRTLHNKLHNKTEKKVTAIFFAFHLKTFDFVKNDNTKTYIYNNKKYFYI